MDHPENQNNQPRPAPPPAPGSPLRSPLPYARACVVALAGLQACRRTGLLRDLTCRSCLSGARSAQRVLRQTPQAPRRRLPAAKRRVAGIRVAFFGPVSWRDKKAGRPPGRDPASKKHPPAGSRTSYTPPARQDIRTAPARTYNAATKPTKQPPAPPSDKQPER